MKHPKYQIVAINKNDDNRTEIVVSRQLMHKADAERVVNYHNKTGANFTGQDKNFIYKVKEYKKNY